MLLNTAYEFISARQAIFDGCFDADEYGFEAFIDGLQSDLDEGKKGFASDFISCKYCLEAFIDRLKCDLDESVKSFRSRLNLRG